MSKDNTTHVRIPLLPTPESDAELVQQTLPSLALSGFDVEAARRVLRALKPSEAAPELEAQ